MATNDTGTAKLLRRRTDGAVFASIAPPAAFLSQLIAGDRRPSPGTRARDCATLARTAYATGARNTVRRLPAGYRTTLDV